MSQQIVYATAGSAAGMIGFGFSRLLGSSIGAYYTAEKVLDVKACLRCGYDQNANRILQTQRRQFRREWSLNFRNIDIALRNFPHLELVKAALGGALIGYLYPRFFALGFAWGNGLGVLDAGRKAYWTILAGRPISSV